MIDLCVVTLNMATLLNLFTHSEFYLFVFVCLDSFLFSVWTILLSENTTLWKKFFLLFQFVCPSFTFLALLNILGLSVQWWIEVVKLSVFQEWCFLYYFLIDALYSVEEVSFYSYLLRIFIINRCWVLSNAGYILNFSTFTILRVKKIYFDSFCYPFSDQLL